MMYDSGLILEGGGMRGVFTAGVLDFFLEKNIDFSNCYGVSAGACHCCSYLSKQPGRAFRVNVDYLDNKNYASVYSLIKTGDFFGVKFVYDEIPKKLDKFDYETFSKYEGKFYCGATNCITGEAEYFQLKDLKKDMLKLVASSSLPLLSRFIRIGGIPYLDGGISDSVPIAKSEEDGNVKNVIVLTRNEGYRKEPNKLIGPMKMKYKKYPAIIEAMKNRHEMYNKEMEYIEQEEKEGRIFVIRPSKPITIGRLEKDREKLTALYNEGVKDAENCYEALMEYLEK